MVMHAYIAGVVIYIFGSVMQALKAGYSIESPLPDRDGLLHARIRTAAGDARAFVRLRK